MMDYKLTPEQSRLVSENIGLVFFTLSMYDGNDRDTLISDGYMGLIQAAKSYNPEKAQFSTWAVTNIKSVVSRGLRQKRLIHIPEHVAARGDFDPNDYVRSVSWPRNDEGEEIPLEDILLEELGEDRYERDLSSLDEREKRVVLLLLMGYTFTEIADDLGVSRQRGWQIAHRIPEKLRKAEEALLNSNDCSLSPQSTVSS